ncbi:hypothetical protein ACIBHY_42485 [Nonomuraea sp. NPDC050547]|uniref:hypothetical protein n=1 Tax=unclassified Nonomuraea TaxID=2593643 RepID=UPI0037B9B779
MTSPIKLDVSLGVGLRSGCGCASLVVLILVAMASMSALGAGMTTFQTAVTLGLFAGVPILGLIGVWIFLRRGTAAWLEGTTLVRKVAYRTVRVDLTRATLVYTGHSLIVREPETGSFRLALRTPLPEDVVDFLKEHAGSRRQT